MVIIYDHWTVDHSEDMKCFCFDHHYSNIKFDKLTFYLSFAMT